MEQMRWLELLSAIRLGSKKVAQNWLEARFIKITIELYFPKVFDN
jgi:hypothetical protein